MGTEKINEQNINNNLNTQPLSRWLHITYMVSLALLLIGIILIALPALLEDKASFTNAVQPFFLWVTIVSVATNVLLLIYALASKVSANKKAALLSLFSLLLFQVSYFIFVGVYFSACCVAE